MAKTWFGEILLTADASNTRVYVPMQFNKNVILQAVRFRILKYNNPSLTSIGGRLYSDAGSSTPGALIANSTDTRTFSALLTHDNGIVETYVTFNKIPLRRDTVYHFLLTLNGYTGNSSSHIAFEHSCDCPMYTFSERTFSKLLLRRHAYPIFDLL